jgi:hypothetical protein
MKRITIRRNRKPTQPPPPPPEPDMEDETSEYSSSESLAESEPLSEAIGNLRVTEQTKPRPQVRFEPQARPVRRATNVERQSFPVQPRSVNPYAQQKRPRTLAAPRSITYDKPLRQTRGKRNVSFASPYGPNGYQLSTQEKSRRLYYTCFG